MNYTYDVLNRPLQAGTLPFAYDGFGNLTQQGQTTLSVDPTTNRINSAGYQYNANGNVVQTPNPTTTYTYDVANRLVSNNAIYNPRNQRVFDETNIYLYTPEGRLAGKYTPNWRPNGSVAIIQGNQPNVYFAGKLIQEGSNWVMTDRLGSVRLNGSPARSSYQPYGTEVAPTTSDQRTKFATYYRDSAGLDYAGQRYYGNGMGRFLTPDPGGARTANPADPGSWNRYAYVNGDPINFTDRRGLVAEPADFGGYVSPLFLPAPNPIPEPDPDPPDPAFPSQRPAGQVPPFQIYDAYLTKEYQTMLRYRIGKLGNCTRILGGASAADFEVATSDIAFFDGQLGGPGSNRTQNMVSGNGNSATLAETVLHSIAGTLTDIRGIPQNEVILGSDFFHDPTVSRPDTLLHEALHVTLGLGDQGLKAYLSQYGFTPGYGGTGGTDDITQWLKDNCPGGKQ